MTTPTALALNLPSPGSAADYYATHWPKASEAQMQFEHGGPETRKGGKHAPVLFRNLGGTFTAKGCMCGWRPAKPPQSPNGADASYRAHIRREGLPAIRNFHHAVYAFGEGYPAEGLTWDEWYAATKGLAADLHPFGPRR